MHKILQYNLLRYFRHEDRASRLSPPDVDTDSSISLSIYIQKKTQQIRRYKKNYNVSSYVRKCIKKQKKNYSDKF